MEEAKSNALVTDSLRTMLEEQQVGVEETGTPKSGTTESKTEKGVSMKKSESPKEGDEFKGDDGVKERFDGEEWVVIDDSPKKIKIGKEEYSSEEIEEWRKNHENSSKWKKENTQKAQEISEKRSNLESVVPLIQKLQELSKSDDEDIQDAMETIKEHLGKDTIKKALSFNANAKYEHPDTERIKELTEKNEELDITVNRNNELWNLCKKHRISQTKAENVEAFALQRYEEKGSLLSLEDALILYDQKNASKTAETPKPKSDKTKGASAIEETQEIKTKEDFHSALRKSFIAE